MSLLLVYLQVLGSYLLQDFKSNVLPYVAQMYSSTFIVISYLCVWGGDLTEQPYSRQGLTIALLANDLVVAKQSNTAQQSQFK